MSKLIEDYIEVNNNKIGIMRVGNEDYISLTDLAKIENSNFPANVIIHWMSSKNTLNFLGLWERLNNDNFNLTGFREIKNEESNKSSFTLSPKKWIKLTNSIGIISTGGKYSTGTYAHSDIAFEFASWISTEFKLYLIKEFKRLKVSEAYREKMEWQATRTLTKLNYLVHTSAIKDNIVPILTDRQKCFIYQEEADLLNVALFGMTAKEWREANPILAKEGNIRDYTDLNHLVILNNLETINANFIEEGLNQKDRLIKLNNIARKQMNILLGSSYNKNIE